MIRLLAVSMLCLALAGCAQSKGALSRGASYPASPVAITPVPSIYDTINKGVGGNAVAQTAIKNPDDPQWAGQTQVSVAARPIPPGAPGATSGPGTQIGPGGLPMLPPGHPGATPGTSGLQITPGSMPPPGGAPVIVPPAGAPAGSAPAEHAPAPAPTGGAAPAGGAGNGGK